MSVVNVKTKEEFDAVVQSAARAAVHFWATWCEPCTHMDSVFSQLASENPRDKFIRVSWRHPLSPYRVLSSLLQTILSEGPD